MTIGSVLRIRYELIEALDEGPVFSTFLARDKHTGIEYTARLFREPYASEMSFIQAVTEVVERTKDLVSPNIERLIEVDTHDGMTYILGEASSGMRLTERIRKLAPFSVPLAVATSIEIAEALATVHRAGLVHGDVGSHNIMLQADNSVRLQMTAVWQAYSQSTKAGAALLKQMAPYLATEVCEGLMPTARSDVYALGVLMYEMLTGKTPFPGESPKAIFQRHVSQNAPNVRTLNPSVPVALNDLVARCLSKNPGERPADGAAVLSELRLFQDALRFGRSAAVAPRPTPPSVDPVPVAPKMSAIESPAKRAPRKSRELDVADTGIPVVLKALILFFSAVLLSMIGMFLIFNIKKPEMVRVPDLRNMSIVEANDQLAKIGLTLRVSQRQASEEIPRDHIIDISPRPDQSVFTGSTITAVVSSGSADVDTPDLRGRTLEEARTLLRTLDLALSSRVTERPAVEGERQGIIVEQDPSPGQRVGRYAEVSVTVTGRRAPLEIPTEELPVFSHRIRFDLDDLTESTVVRVDITDPDGTRTVYDERHNPGDRVDFETNTKGETATLRVYYGNRLVETVTIRGTR